VLIPGLPLAAFVLLIFLGRRLGRWSAWISAGALASSGAVTWWLAESVFQGHWPRVSWPWFASSDPLWTVGLRVDGLSWMMLAVVTSIGTLIQLYSIGYMRDDPRFSRFFAYLSLFCAAMLGLVMADHFVLLYACWELVGLCSYLLISFWFEKPAAAAAGRKAFLTTRLGDVGLLLGILCLAMFAGELHLDRLDTIRWKFLLLERSGFLTAISLMIFFGAVGKSAQIPLHVWLPDAMEGPTPVSALIHAATMVAAGVYLVARTLPLFTPESLQVVLGIGLATHLLAATVALTQTDIKRVLAYSTVSQLGLMFTALGLGAMAAGMFHLLTHAFFKALLFLGAGSVIHAAHAQELSELGGLRRAMPWTAATFGIAAVAMSGLPPLSGFWSKDAILLAAGHHAPWVEWAILGGAVLTASYIFRLYLRCFHGAPAAHGHQSPHESPGIMVWPMAVLALGAAGVGLLGSPVTHFHIFHWLGVTEAHEGIAWSLVFTSVVVAGLGLALAWVVGFQGRSLVPEALRPLTRRLARLAANKYYVDEAYDRVVITPFLAVTRGLARFDQRVIDGAVDGAGAFGAWLGRVKAWVDQALIDRFVNGMAAAVRGLGVAGRRLQTGIIQQYLLVVVVGVMVVSFVIHR